MFVAGAKRKAIVYNGSFPGPTLVADPGDRIFVRLVNRLATPTNLHTHGFHVAPGGNADNVMLSIPAGGTFDYQYEIPRDHAPGPELVPPASARGRHAPDVRRRGRCRDLPLGRRAARRRGLDARPRARSAGAGVGRERRAQDLVGGAARDPAAPGQRTAESPRPDPRGRDAALADRQRVGERLLRPAPGRARLHADRGGRQPVRARGRARGGAHPAGRPGRGPGSRRRARQLRAARAAVRPRRRLRVTGPRARDRRGAPPPPLDRSRSGPSRCSRRSATSGSYRSTSSGR